MSTAAVAFLLVALLGVSGAQAAPLDSTTAATPSVDSSPTATTTAPSGEPSPSVSPTTAPPPIVVGLNVKAKWLVTGGETGSLGKPISKEVCSSVCQQEFVGGMIFARDQGVPAVIYRSKGKIGPAWFAAGGVSGGQPLPQSDEVELAGRYYQTFQNGGNSAITVRTWTPTQSFKTIPDVGGFAEWWLQVGAKTLGFPLAAQVCRAYGSCVQKFENATLSLHNVTFAIVKGAIRSKWQATGSETGPLGYPIASEFCEGSTPRCVQAYGKGYILWSSKTGAWAVKGAILGRYEAEGNHRGSLGLPLADELCGLKGGGCLQKFQGGTIYYSKSTGTWTVKGGIGSRYAQIGAQNSSLGYPKSREICDSAPRRCVQAFQGGDIMWGPTTGTHTLKGAIRIGFNGGVTAGFGLVGLPTSEEYCGLSQGGCYQQFQSGRIYWSPKSGPAQTLKNGMLRKWLSLGGEKGYLGYPVWNEICSMNTCFQHFQGGTLYWTGTSGPYM